MGTNYLLALLERDQRNIKEFAEGRISREKLLELNSQISDKFKEYIRDNGFLFKNIVSEDVYMAGIALTLHSDIDFLKSTYEEIKGLGQDEIDSKHKAYIADKILVLEGRPQLYGTQLKQLPNGSEVLFPVEKPEELKMRRAEMGFKD